MCVRARARVCVCVCVCLYINMYEADLDGGFVWRSKKHVFGLEVAMNNVLFLQEVQRPQELHRY